ncbi:hypothetical protein CWM66_15070 [Kosakonia sp. H7A]|nr:hypothetical protein CWM66_15070 [Kosakonia sp. H7A]
MASLSNPGHIVFYAPGDFQVCRLPATRNIRDLCTERGNPLFLRPNNGAAVFLLMATPYGKAGWP